MICIDVYVIFLMYTFPKSVNASGMAGCSVKNIFLFGRLFIIYWNYYYYYYIIGVLVWEWGGEEDGCTSEMSTVWWCQTEEPMMKKYTYCIKIIKLR